MTVPLTIEGWHTFRVKSAAREWISDATRSTNWGLTIVAVSVLGQPVPMRISRRCDRNANQQPVLVLFNDDYSSVALTKSVAPVTGQFENRLKSTS